jgi:hypothetical protein
VSCAVRRIYCLLSGLPLFVERGGLKFTPILKRSSIIK